MNIKNKLREVYEENDFLVLLTAGLLLGVVVALLYLNWATHKADEQLDAERRTTTTVIEELTPVSPEIGSGAACIRLGTAWTDPTMHNLSWDGYNIDYRKGMWYFEEEVIGASEAEDSAFVACSTPDVVDIISKYQSDAIAAGAKPEYES